MTEARGPHNSAMVSQTAVTKSITLSVRMKYAAPPPDRKSGHISRIVIVLGVLLVAVLAV